MNIAPTWDLLGYLGRLLGVHSVDRHALDMAASLDYVILDVTRALLSNPVYIAQQVYKDKDALGYVDYVGLGWAWVTRALHF